MGPVVLQVEAGDAVLHVSICGDGGPHVLVPHPFQWLDDTGGSLGSVFSGAARCVFVHPRGSGRSTGDDLSTDTLVGDLDVVRRAIDVEDWIVWGQSGGGVVAMLYALRFPQSTRALVLSCTTANGIDAQSVYHPSNPAHAAAAAALASGDSEALTPLIANRHDLVLARSEEGGQSSERVEAYFAERRGDLLPLLPQLTMPALVVEGRHDNAIPVHHQEQIAAAVPNSELLVFEESGHFPYIEERDRFIRIVSKFVASV